MSQRTEKELQGLLRELLALPAETEWVEFKHNRIKPDDLGAYISALSNGAALSGKLNGYMVWGIDDASHKVIGTDFVPATDKRGGQELESWLLQKLSPRIYFTFHSLNVDEKPVVILEIAKASHTPVQFDSTEFIRIGSYKKKLKDFPEKERALWRAFDATPFEDLPAMEQADDQLVLSLLDYPSYFELLELPLPDNRAGILEKLAQDDLITVNDSGTWNITNLGALLFARDFSKFKKLKRKAVRVVIYKGRNKLETVREQVGGKGYASGFEGLISFINSHVPRNEVMGQALRMEVPMFPELAVRELVANALIHQDLFASGTSPMVEIFEDRMEITNPGIPLVDTDRFLDSPPRSRNEAMASLLRRSGICEERGSGIDKVVAQTEVYQLPAPLFEIRDDNTQVVLFGHKNLNEMDQADRIRACYQHACLKWVERSQMTNSTLRERFGIDPKNSATVSRVIKDTLAASLIRPFDENQGKRNARYIPFWA
ncbi:putative DNA binding domain-containing protein [Sansalvadorimonas sp. 2012CJ34-2]|uniref:DNA binding domain-containing protein n=1 Tax=Parendozoicomonas callyspongiae TaxID=2942213 RepID=A0ABT0PNW8_9GAMM|nr:ATP-binding protein [Sansalvadorimonas sp. 2012CJ34-2]MCL6272143.1 putative DNA binding domain-containing protein [Sansalvadorimonas sp. 2012CJ34-2]